MHVSSWPGLSPILPLLKESVSSLPFPFSRERKIYASSALSLVYHLFRALELDAKAVVLAPDYHPARAMRAIRSAGAHLRFYRTKRDLTVDLEDLEDQLSPEAKVLYVIHHFGFPQPIEALSKIAKERGLILIEDCSESLFSFYEERPLGSFGAHAVFCLQTALPVPNGGLLLASGKALETIERVRWRPNDLSAVALPSLRLMLGRGRPLIERTTDVLLGNGAFDPDRARYEMAPLTRHLLERIDFDAVPERRRDVYSRLLHRLDGWITPLKGELGAGVCPLFLPVAIEEKHAAIEQLRARGVGAIDPGSSADPGVDERRSKDARWLREHAVGIPAHQDLGLEHIAHVVRSVRELGLTQRTGVVHTHEAVGDNVVNLLDSGPLRPLSKSG
jgi:perosamine synthetase